MSKISPICFVDSELTAYISAAGKNGKCDFSGESNVPVIDLDELMNFFQELLENFEPLERGNSLISIIQSDWNFFSSDEVAENILNEVLSEIESPFHDSTNPAHYAGDIRDSFNYWQFLKEDIKWKRRYVQQVEFIEEELGWDGSFNAQFELKPEQELYRARIHHKSDLQPYSVGDMFAPDPTIARAGRANPAGIPALYLSDSEQTVLYEARALYLDELSIGVFRLKKDVEKPRIVDFTADIPLYQPDMVNEIIKTTLLLRTISEDLSKPMRRYDSEIEYIPTQFICEFIREITGAKGIRFTSSLDPSGKNIVIFDQHIMECVEVRHKKISELTLKAIDIG